MKLDSPVRKYGKSDATFISSAASVIHYLSQELEHFASFDSSVFSEEYVASLLAKIEQIHSLPGDNVIRAQLAQKTEAMTRSLEAAVDEMQVAKYFVAKSYKRGSAEYNSFGFKELARIRYNPQQMLLLFESFLFSMENGKVRLIAANYPASKFADLRELYHTFQEQRTAQRTFKKDRKNYTTERVTLLNELWNEVKRVEEVATKYLFKREPEKGNLFKL